MEMVSELGEQLFTQVRLKNKGNSITVMSIGSKMFCIIHINLHSTLESSKQWIVDSTASLQFILNVILGERTQNAT